MDLDEVMLCVDWQWCHIGSCSTCSLADNPRVGHHDLDGHIHHTPLVICSLSGRLPGGIWATWRGRTIISLSMPSFCMEALAGRYKICFWTCWSSIKVYWVKPSLQNWVKFTGRALLLNALHEAWQQRVGHSSHSYSSAAQPGTSESRTTGHRHVRPPTAQLGRAYLLLIFFKSPIVSA